MIFTTSLQQQYNTVFVHVRACYRQLLLYLLPVETCSSMEPSHTQQATGPRETTLSVRKGWIICIQHVVCVVQSPVFLLPLAAVVLLFPLFFVLSPSTTFLLLFLSVATRRTKHHSFSLTNTSVYSIQSIGLSLDEDLGRVATNTENKKYIYLSVSLPRTIHTYIRV